jgi:hypothetical protein
VPDFAYKASATLQVPGELRREVGESCTTLCPGGFLQPLRNRRADGQLMADPQCDGFQENGLVTLQALELASKRI